jgi:hypothetical protein
MTGSEGDFWFERVGVSAMRPISAEGRRAYAILFGGMLAAIPLSVAVALLGAPPLLALVPLAAGFVGVPLWFLWSVRGHVKV